MWKVCTVWTCRQDTGYSVCVSTESLGLFQPLMYVVMCRVWHRNSCMVASRFSICRCRSLGDMIRNPMAWSCGGWGGWVRFRANAMTPERSKTNTACAGVFSDATNAGKPFCGLLVFYIYTPDIFAFRSHFTPTFSLLLPTSPSHGACLCALAPKNLRVSLQSVWVLLAFGAYVPHPRSQGSHFSTSYRLHVNTSLLNNELLLYFPYLGIMNRLKIGETLT